MNNNLRIKRLKEQIAKIKKQPDFPGNMYKLGYYEGQLEELQRISEIRNDTDIEYIECTKNLSKAITILHTISEKGNFDSRCLADHCLKEIQR